MTSTRPIASLPSLASELLEQILSHLQAKDLKNLCLVSRAFVGIVQQTLVKEIVHGGGRTLQPNLTKSLIYLEAKPELQGCVQIYHVYTRSYYEDTSSLCDLTKFILHHCTFLRELELRDMNKDSSFWNTLENMLWRSKTPVLANLRILRLFSCPSMTLCVAMYNWAPNLEEFELHNMPSVSTYMAWAVTPQSKLKRLGLYLSSYSSVITTLLNICASSIQYLALGGTGGLDTSVALDNLPKLRGLQFYGIVEPQLVQIIFKSIEKLDHLNIGFDHALVSILPPKDLAKLRTLTSLTISTSKSEHLHPLMSLFEQGLLSSLSTVKIMGIELMKAIIPILPANVKLIRLYNWAGPFWPSTEFLEWLAAPASNLQSLNRNINTIVYVRAHGLKGNERFAQLPHIEFPEAVECRVHWGEAEVWSSRKKEVQLEELGQSLATIRI